MVVYGRRCQGKSLLLQALVVRRLLVARSGFTNELKRIARRRGDVELVDLDRLYTGS